MPTDITTQSSSGRRQDVFAVSADDGQCYHAVDDGRAWHPWESLGGSLTSAASASAVYDAQGSPLQFDVYARGKDGQMYRNEFTTGWSGWQPMGGNLASAPIVASVAFGAQGPKGDPGQKGDKGDKGDPGSTFDPSGFSKVGHGHSVTGTAT